VVNKPGAMAHRLKYVLSQRRWVHGGIGPMTDAWPTRISRRPNPSNSRIFPSLRLHAQQRVLYTRPDNPYKTFSEFIQFAKKNPGQVSAGSGDLNGPWRSSNPSR